jgi:hypothetical protein
LKLITPFHDATSLKPDQILVAAGFRRREGARVAVDRRQARTTLGHRRASNRDADTRQWDRKLKDSLRVQPRFH